jgi:hypothetical protein
VTITPPSPFEVSADNTIWYTSSSPLVINPVSGTLAQQTLYLRLNASSIGNYNGNVINATNGLTSILFPITGVTYAASTSFPLQQWPLTQNNSDSAAVRSPAVLASTSSLNNLFTSDGTQPLSSPIPAYSGQFGQALGANTTGNGWANVGSTLKRNFYEQFTVTAITGSQVRVDSLTFLSDFYNTISGIKMAVVYSKNGFTSPADSAEFFSGVGPGGVSLTLATSGTFSKSFTLQRNDAGPVNRYALSLNGADGITLNSGETITIRLYWGCGSSSIPRFAFLKDVIVKGVVLSPVPLQLVNFTAQNKSEVNFLQWHTQNEFSMNKTEVEKSEDGVLFKKIGTLSALNKTHNYYQFSDNKVWPMQFYRLKFIDVDGNYNFSPARKITVSSNSKLILSPNPANDFVKVYHRPSTMESVLKIFDNNGKLLLKRTVEKGESETLINTENLPAGIYPLIYQDGLDVFSATLLIQTK